MKYLLGLLISCLLSLGACQQSKAVVCGAYPFTFVNGQVANAVQVNADFNWVKTCLNNTNVNTFDALRANTAAPPSIIVAGATFPADGLGGLYVYNPLDTTSPDNGSTIIVDAAGHRWYRQGGTASYTVNTVAELEGLPIAGFASGFSVTLQGYRTAGDAPSVLYALSKSACSLNSGAGDGGGQLPSTTPNNCWLIGAHTFYDPRNWGAVGNGTTNDAVAFQNLVNAAQNSTIVIGNNIYRLNTGITSAGPIHIVGPGVTINAGLRAGATNLNLLTLSGGDSLLSGFRIDMGNAGTNTSGTAITTSATGQNTTIEDVVILNPCIGLDINGNKIHVNRVRVDDFAFSGCYGARVGNLTTGAGTLAEIVSSTFASSQSSPATADLLILDAGGLYLGGNDDFLFATNGTLIRPGLNQQVIWLFAENSAIADTNAGEGIVVDTADSGAIVQGLYFNGTWSANTLAAGKGDCIHIKNTAGGLIGGVHFVGHRAMNCGGNGLEIDGLNSIFDISYDSGSICSNSKGNPDQFYNVYINNNAQDISITNSFIKASCNGLHNGPVHSDIFFGSNTAQIDIIGNIMYDATCTTCAASGIVTVGTPTSGVVTNNGGIDTAQPVIAISGGVINLTANPNYSISGTGTINTINGQWVGRTATLINSAGTNTFTGGNICNSTYTSAQNVPVIAMWQATCWALK